MFRAICKNWTTMPASMLFAAFCYISSFFFPTSLLIRTSTWRWRFFSNAVGTVIPYGNLVSSWQLSNASYRVCTTWPGSTGRILYRKVWKKCDRIWLSYIADVWTTMETLTTGQICSLLSLRSTNFLLVTNSESFSAEYLRKSLNSFLSMLLFVVGNPVVSTYSKNPFTGSSRKINFALKTAVTNSTWKAINMLRLMSGTHILTKFVKYNIRKRWREDRKMKVIFSMINRRIYHSLANNWKNDERK